MHSAHPRRGRAPVALATGALALALCALGAAPAHAAPTAASVALTATPAAVDAGDAIQVVIGLDGAQDVFAYELEISFDPEQLEYVDGSAIGPVGGFDTVDAGDGSVTLLHTRLGSSPSLAGDLEAVLQFLALDEGGDADIVLSSVTLVGDDGASVAQIDAADTVVEITPAPVVAPSPSPSASSGTGSPAPSPSGSSSTAPAAGGSSTEELSNTGADTAPMLVVAVAAVAAGLLGLGAAAVRRRKAAQR